MKTTEFHNKSLRERQRGEKERRTVRDSALSSTTTRDLYSLEAKTTQAPPHHAQRHEVKISLGIEYLKNTTTIDIKNACKGTGGGVEL